MKSYYPAFVILLLTQQLSCASVSVEFYSQESQFQWIITTPHDIGKLILYPPAGYTYSEIRNLDKLKKLKTLIFPGSGYGLKDDSFLKQTPQLEVLIFKNVSGPFRWSNLAGLKNLKVLIHRAVGILPDGIDFAPGAELEFVALQDLENLPYLRGYKSIKVLDISDGIFQTPPPGSMESLYRRIGTIHMDNFVFPPGSWAPENVKFRGVEFYYRNVYKDADF